MPVVRRILFLALLSSACKTGSSNTGIGAATTSAVAIGAAVAERASGGCVAICTAGTVCNRTTGLCEPLPCRGECGANEHCEQTFSGEKCVAGGPTSVEALVKGNAATVPASIAPATAPPNPGEPTIVPAAENAPPH